MCILKHDDLEIQFNIVEVEEYYSKSFKCNLCITTLRNKNRYSFCLPVCFEAENLFNILNSIKKFYSELNFNSMSGDFNIKLIDCITNIIFSISFNTIGYNYTDKINIERKYEKDFLNKLRYFFEEIFLDYNAFKTS
jgi:hypothetical protein